MQATHTQAQKTVAGAHFPATRAELLDHAARFGADDELLTRLRDLPDRTYRDPNDVGTAFTELTGC